MSGKIAGKNVSQAERAWYFARPFFSETPVRLLQRQASGSVLIPLTPPLRGRGPSSTGFRNVLLKRTGKASEAENQGTFCLAGAK